MGVQPYTVSYEPLHIRAPVPADAEAVYQACQDPLIGAWTARVPVPFARLDAEEFLRDIVPAGWASGRELTWAIADPSTDTLLGIISLNGVDTGCPAVGYWLAAQARGRGVATQALAEVCRSGFERFGLAAIRWEALAGNEASLRTAERVGFRISGPVPKLLPQPGEWRDGWIGALSPSDRPLLGPDILTGESLTLRPFRGSDLGQLPALIDDAVLRWTGVPGRTPEELAPWLDALRRPNCPPVARYAITSCDGELLGALRLSIEALSGSVSVGWWLGPSGRGKGYAAQALRLAMPWAVSHGAERFSAGIFDGNTPSIRLAERLGMRCEGLRRAYWPPRVPGDPRRDTWLYSLVVGDPGWPPAEPAADG